MDDSIFYKYTTEDAENDGVLFKIYHINPDWEKGIFSHVTTNLLSCGYEKEGMIIVPNMLDLLNQCAEIVRKKSNDYQDFDSFFKGSIEFPSGEQREVFICENEIRKFTIMLPEDY